MVTNRGQYSESPENEPDLDAADKKKIEARFFRLFDVGNSMLEALLPGTADAPLERIDRQRRTTMNIYLTYVARLVKLQETRLIVTLPSQPQPTTTARERTDAKRPQRLLAEEAANQNHLKPDNDVAEK